MTLGDLLVRVRNQLSEFRPTAWTDMRLTTLINDAQSSLSLRLDFPRQTLTIPVPGQVAAGPAKVQIPEIVKIWNVFIEDPSGSIVELFGTDIGTLEGDWLQSYDNTSGTINGAPLQSPQWLTGIPVPPPYQSVQVGGWVPTKLPWQNTQNQRGAYAMQGGYMIILPSYSTATTLMLDAVPAPPIMVNPQDPSIFPQSFANAIKWKAVADARAADVPGAPSIGQALQMYEAELAQNVSQVERLQATNPKIFVPNTIRGLRRWGSWGWS